MLIGSIVLDKENNDNPRSLLAPQGGPRICPSNRREDAGVSEDISQRIKIDQQDVWLSAFKFGAPITDPTEPTWSVPSKVATVCFGEDHALRIIRTATIGPMG